MVEDDHRRYEEELAAYLLDALEPDELRGFRAHLEGCARCQGDERWLRAAVEQLPSSVEQFEPSPALRKRLMGRVQTEAAVDKVPPQEEHHRRRRWTLSLRTAAALATVAVAAAGFAGYLVGQDDGTTTTTIQAEATPAEPTARASLVRTGDSAELKVERLPVQRPGHVYKAWLLRGKQPEPSSLFVVGKDGSGSAVVTGSLDGVDAVLVTEEPDGSTSKPTGDPVLSAKL
jgi:anti-sigma factor RsiW